MGCLCFDHLITGLPLMSEPAQEKWFSQTIHISEDAASVHAVIVFYFETLLDAK